MITVNCINKNGNIVMLYGDRISFRLRQRSKDSDGCKVKPLHFISRNKMKKVINEKVCYGPSELYTISKL